MSSSNGSRSSKFRRGNTLSPGHSGSRRGGKRSKVFSGRSGPFTDETNTAEEIKNKEESDDDEMDDKLNEWTTDKVDVGVTCDILVAGISSKSSKNVLKGGSRMKKKKRSTSKRNSPDIPHSGPDSADMVGDSPDRISHLKHHKIN